ncbi:hypothetical protein V1523DRAFT_421879 [Lipomyces doorenjongii]
MQGSRMSIQCVIICLFAIVAFADIFVNFVITGFGVGERSRSEYLIRLYYSATNHGNNNPGCRLLGAGLLVVDEAFLRLAIGQPLGLRKSLCYR